MSETEGHINQVPGWVLLNESDGCYQSVLVIGHERSGTSMIAGVLSKLGVFMGDQFIEPVYEDRRLGTALNKKRDFKSIIKEYSAAHPLWGIKLPKHNIVLLKNIKLFNKPLVIFIARDPVSVAQRCSHVYNRRFDSEIKTVLKNQYNLTKLVSSFKKTPTLFCSYEKVINKPDDFVHEVIRIMGLSPSNKQLSNAIEFIIPESESYLNVSAPQLSFQGYVDHIESNIIHGWVCYRKEPSKSVSLTVLVEGQEVGFERTETYRKDLVDQGIHPTGECGFIIKVLNRKIMPEDKVEIRLAKEKAILLQSNDFAQV